MCPSVFSRIFYTHPQLSLSLSSLPIFPTSSIPPLFSLLHKKVRIRLTELSGAVRMGVRKHRTFISFLSEPYSCFEVNSSLGKKETKMHNLKRLDSAVVQRIKAVSHSTDQSAESFNGSKC